MAIGTALAIGLGSAVLGAGATAIGASKNSKAINTATAAQSESNAAAIAAQENARAGNLALQQPIYDAGMPAIQARNALLGLGGQQQAQPQPNALSNFYSGANPGANPMRGTMPMGNQADGQYPGAQFWQFGGQTGIPVINAQPNRAAPEGTIQTSQAAANDAFQAFRDSTGYQFRMDEANSGFSANAAGQGWLQSGAAITARDAMNQNLASNEFGQYFGMLGEQQNLTAGAANAMSGVNTTYANNAGNLAIANGQNIANGAVASANNSNALWGGLANTAGNVLGQYAYGGFGK